jgi:Tfp pilus assembly protein PilV
MNSRTCRRRSGMAVLIVLVILLVFGVAMSLAMQTNLAARAEARRAAARLQAEYLATAGLELAQSRLNGDADYAGETWQVPAEEIGGSDRAEVRIEIASVAEQPEQRRVTVLAVYPLDDDVARRHQYRLEALWNTSTPSDRSAP